MHLVHDDGGVMRRGRIVETEAYQGPRDLAAHSARGRTARTEIMYGPPGHAYVYFIYGFWNCLNVVTSPVGTPHAVLLRALEPVSGMSARSFGPGLLCRALNIDRRLNGADLLGKVLWIERAPARAAPPRIARATRIGVEYAGAWAARRWDGRQPMPRRNASFTRRSTPDSPSSTTPGSTTTTAAKNGWARRSRVGATRSS